MQCKASRRGIELWDCCFGSGDENALDTVWVTGLLNVG